MECSSLREMLSEGRPETTFIAQIEIKTWVDRLVINSES